MKLGSLKIGVGGAVQIGISAAIISLLLASCGGGGNTNTGEIYTGTPPAAPGPVDGPDSFLLYPNPQVSPPVDSETYARAYYAAIDPANTKDTLEKFMSVNGFGNLSTGSEVQAVFGDMRDLGYGRYVTARRNTDGTMVFLTANYLVWSAAGYGYSSMNLDAAVAKDRRWYIGTNTIEYSPGPNGGRPFVKYYSYDTNGVRVLEANLDGRGSKAMPGICTNCHGGRGDPLTAADASGNQLFSVVGNPASGVRGDLKGRLHFFEPDTFSFSALPGYSRAEQEAKIKTLNQWVLCSYPLPTSSIVPTGFAEDACRTEAPTLGEWQGGAATVVKAAYGGDGMLNATYSDNYVPASWVVAGQTSLYRNVVQPACRMCHILRGTGEQSDTDFSTYESFRKQAEDIRSHVVDLGNMPSTKVLYSRYWATPGMQDELNAFFLAQTPNPASNPYAATPDILYRVLDATSGAARAGRPIASAGPSRTVSTGASTLDAQYSKYADTYQWSIYSSPASAVNSPATLSSTTAVKTTFNATVDGTYIVKLVAGKGTVQSDPSYIALVVNSALTPLPSAIRFADIKRVLQNSSGAGGGGCNQCHFAAGATGGYIGNGGSKVYASYEDIDRDGDGIVASGVGGTDDIWFYNEVRGRINLSDIADSPLLRKPSGHGHDTPTVGNTTVRTGFGDKTLGTPAEEFVPGDVKRQYYDLFLNWILNGAPYQ